MDTEKQRQHRRDDVRLTESGDARSEQQLMMPKESLLTNGEWLPRERWMPGWFLDMNIRLVISLLWGIQVPQINSSKPLFFVTILFLVINQPINLFNYYSVALYIKLSLLRGIQASQVLEPTVSYLYSNLTTLYNYCKIKVSFSSSTMFAMLACVCSLPKAVFTVFTVSCVTMRLPCLLHLLCLPCWCIMAV